MKYMIVAHPRSGSNLLARALNEHPQITNMGELFGTNHHKGSCSQRIKKLEAKAKEDKTPIYGAKILYFHYDYRKNANEGDLWQEIKDNGFQVIHLTRRSWFEGFVSYRLAQITKKWVGPEYYKIKRDLTLEVNLAKLQEVLNEWRDGFSTVERMFDTHAVSYEDLCNRWVPTVNGVLDFLGARRVPLPHKIRKQMNVPHRSIVKNYDEVIKWMKGNGFADRV